MSKRFSSVFPAMLPVGAMLGLLVAAVITYVMPKIYESEAVIEVRPRETTMGDKPQNVVTPQYFATEFEVMKSRSVLSKVVENLELSNRWSMDNESAVQMLKNAVITQNIKGTDLISIRVRHTNKIDARDIVMEIATAYKDYRNEIGKKNLEARLHELNKAVVDQEDKVEERRKVLATIVRTKGIIYRGPGTSDGQAEISEDQSARSALDTYQQFEQEKTQLESQINSLLKYENEELMAYAAGLDLPDNILKNLYPEYLEQKRNLNSLQVQGLGIDHPTMLNAKQKLDLLKSQLDEGVVALRATLQAQLALTADRLKNIEATKNESHEGLKRSIDSQDYVDAKRDYETDQTLLQTMKLKQVEETISFKMPNDAIVIHEEPVIAESPISPNVTLNLGSGAALGMLISPLLALLAMSGSDQETRMIES